ncbi:MAG: hypothetical protein NW226_09905 [Microscillaceae bacterium]|nr:hypothetical protein [Microscillaceae bacterium]
MLIIALLFRLAVILGVIMLIIYVFRDFFPPSDFIRCGRCEGKGYWYAARGRETCDWCKGSGKLPRNMEDMD